MVATPHKFLKLYTFFGGSEALMTATCTTTNSETNFVKFRDILLTMPLNRDQGQKVGSHLSPNQNTSNVIININHLFAQTTWWMLLSPPGTTTY